MARTKIATKTIWLQRETARERYQKLPAAFRAVVDEVATRRDLAPFRVLHPRPTPLEKWARREVWARLYARGMSSRSTAAIASWWGVDHSTVAYNVRRWRGMPSKHELQSATAGRAIDRNNPSYHLWANDPAGAAA